MSGGKHFECILIYSALDIGVTEKKFFGSQDINLAPRHASEIVLLKSSLDSKRYAAVYDASSGYYNLSTPTVNLTLNSSYFSGQ